MAVELKPGQQLASTVCATKVVVVRATSGAIMVTCGGQVMVPADLEPARKGVPEEGADDGALIGKRYTDPEGTIELLCTRSGDGTLAADGLTLEVKVAKPLPSSD